MEERELVVALRAGEERAFTHIVATHHTALVRIAKAFVGSDSAAQDVAQETWVAVLDGIGSFEERSSFKTWLFRILVNRARTRAKKQGREVSFDDEQEDDGDPTIYSRGGYRTGAPRPWGEVDLDNKKIVAIVRREIENLPDAQRAVVVMRDIEGLESSEVCNVLGVTETNQRVLLHRARMRLRAQIEKELAEP